MGGYGNDARRTKQRMGKNPNLTHRQDHSPSPGPRRLSANAHLSGWMVAAVFRKTREAAIAANQLSLAPVDEE